jgi:protein-ribulosamine 3-kinase
MSSKNKTHPAQDQFSSIRLARDPLRIPVEKFVSEHTGRQWRIKDARDMTEFACHPCAILSDGSFSVFAKFSEAANGMEQFEIELAGLRLLAERAGVLTPTPLGILTVEGGALMILQAVREVERGPRHWRQIGRTLALIHKVKGDRFGLETQGYFGPLYQDNRPMSSWAAFYAERRLYPRLAGAIDSGNLPSPVIRQVEKLIARLPDLCGPEPVPTLLHGDAQQNNYISTQMGTIVIDPAVHYGHPEVDLAFIDNFQPAPMDFFDGYREEMPIDPGFWERRDLWRVYIYLAAVTVEGAGYLKLLTNALQKYV